MKYYNWRDVTVSEVAKIFLGGTPSRSILVYWNGTVKWATAKYVPNEIVAPLTDPVAVWQQFCAESKITHNGRMNELPPQQLEMF